MSLVIGIDGGGTHTRASIVDGEKVLGHGESGSIKRLRVGAEAAEANLREVLKDVYGQAGVKGVRSRLLRRRQRHHARHSRMDHRGLQRLWRGAAPTSSATR